MVLPALLLMCHNFMDYSDIATTFAAVSSLLIHDITGLLAVFLSFQFHHEKYEKICSVCDKWMKRYCRKKAKITISREYDNISNQYELLSNDDQGNKDNDQYSL